MAFFVKPQSSAVKIVKPSVSDNAKTLTPVQKDSVQRQCKNVFIYGRCKYQDKGCSYHHPQLSDAASATPAVSTPSPKLTASAPAFIPPISAPAAIRPSVPSAMITSSPQLDGSDAFPIIAPASPPPSLITSQALNAPVFVPRTAAAVAAGVSASARKAAISPPPHPWLVSNSTENHASVSPPVIQVEPNVQQESGERDQPLDGRPDLQHHRGYSNFSDYDYQSGEGFQSMELSDPYYDQGEYPYDTDPMEASYYNQAAVFLRQPLNYLLYASTMPGELVRHNDNSHFLPSSTELRQLLQEKSETIRGVAPLGMAGLPEELQGYHTLVPLEPTGAGASRRKFGNWHSTVYRAIKVSDGVPHALRRVENYRLINQAAFGPIEAWSKIQHPNIVPVREAFTTKSFNDNSLVMSYAYYSNAKTLYDAHIMPNVQQPPPLSVSGSSFFQTRQHPRQHSQQQPQQQHIPERTLWSYIIQIASAIKKVHDQGLAVQMVDVTKILVTGQNRIRIGSCGIVDVLLHDTEQDIGYLQQEDLTKFGRLILTLCTGNASSFNNPNQVQKALDTIHKVYSLDMQTLGVFFFSKLHKTIDQVLDMVKGKILVEQEEALSAVDRLEDELMGELENARLVRLMAKFGFINERPEFARDARWSETGDRYIIKLFRDYVFHQVDEHGNPLLDLTHVLTCLNKLDAGTDEKVMLVARDEQSCLVVSYKEIKTCMASAFDELVRARQNR